MLLMCCVISSPVRGVAGDYSAAAACLSSSLPILSHIFGADSIEVAREQAKLATLHFNAHQVSPALTAITSALSALRVHGAGEEEVLELEEMQQFLRQQR